MEDGRRPYAGKNGLSCGLEFYHLSYDIDATSLNSHGDMATDAVVFNAKWFHNFSNRIFPYAGVGVGGSYVHYEAEGDIQFNDNRELAGAAQLSAGAEYTFGRSERFWMVTEVKAYKDSASYVVSTGFAALLGMRINLD